MTNPPDDPGYGPPPPRPAPPHTYPGGYQPPPPWQGPQPGIAPRTGKSFFGALFDVNFDDMVTPRLIKAVYVIVILIDTASALFGFILAWSFSEWSAPLAVFTLIATPVMWFFGLFLARMTLEFVINQFKITEHLKALRERGR